MDTYFIARVLFFLVVLSIVFYVGKTLGKKEAHETLADKFVEDAMGFTKIVSNVLSNELSTRDYERIMRIIGAAMTARQE